MLPKQNCQNAIPRRFLAMRNCQHERFPPMPVADNAWRCSLLGDVASCAALADVHFTKSFVSSYGTASKPHTHTCAHTRARVHVRAYTCMRHTFSFVCFISRASHR